MLAPTTLTKEDEHIASRASESVRSREADFERARAHSSAVRLLKLALPVLGVGIVLVFVGYTFLSRVPQLTYDIASVAYADGKLVMSNPKLNGVTSENRPYSMTAERAVQDPAKQHEVALHGIDATVPIDVSDSATILAERGVYNSRSNVLDIQTPFTVKSTNGLTAQLDTAVVDIDNGTMTTTRPVEITMNGNKISAETLSILDNGKVLVFEKRVRLNVSPGALGPAEDSGEQHAGN